MEKKVFITYDPEKMADLPSSQQEDKRIHVYEISTFKRAMRQKTVKYCSFCNKLIADGDVHVHRYREFVSAKPFKYSQTYFCLDCWKKIEGLE